MSFRTEWRIPLLIWPVLLAPALFDVAAARAGDFQRSPLDAGQSAVMDVTRPLAPWQITQSLAPFTIEAGTTVACTTSISCNCCSGGDGTGCDCEPCETKICTGDSFCCEVAWDSVCNAEALSDCVCCHGPCGGDPGPGCNCCRGGDLVGCDDPACQAAVCDIDPFCCALAWDSICNDEAASLCTCCVDPVEGGGGQSPAVSVTTDNGWWRLFDLDADHGLTGTFTVEDIDWATESVVGDQDLTINLYCLDDGLPFLMPFLTLTGTATVSLTDETLEFHNTEVSGHCDASTQRLAVELCSEDCQTSSCIENFIGMNSLGQTAPTYIVAEDCGVVDPLDLAAVGFPHSHLILVVNGEAGSGGGDDGGGGDGGDGGGDGGAGDACGCCNQAGSGIAGCPSCPPCEEVVCSYDPFCCDTLWDDVCDAEAWSLCTCCPGQDPGYCEEPGDDGGGGDDGGDDDGGVGDDGGDVPASSSVGLLLLIGLLLGTSALFSRRQTSGASDK
jgi:hypothetical protein